MKRLPIFFLFLNSLNCTFFAMEKVDSIPDFVLVEFEEKPDSSDKDSQLLQKRSPIQLQASCQGDSTTEKKSTSTSSADAAKPLTTSAHTQSVPQTASEESSVQSERHAAKMVHRGTKPANHTLAEAPPTSIPAILLITKPRIKKPRPKRKKVEPFCCCYTPYDSESEGKKSDPCIIL